MGQHAYAIKFSKTQVLWCHNAHHLFLSLDLFFGDSGDKSLPFKGAGTGLSLEDLQPSTSPRISTSLGPLQICNWISKESSRFRDYDNLFFIPKNRIVRPVEAFRNLYVLKGEGIPRVNEESVFHLYAFLLTRVTICAWYSCSSIGRPCFKAPITRAPWLDARFYWVVARRHLVSTWRFSMRTDEWKNDLIVAYRLFIDGISITV